MQIKIQFEKDRDPHGLVFGQEGDHLVVTAVNEGQGKELGVEVGWRTSELSCVEELDKKILNSEAVNFQFPEDKKDLTTMVRDFELTALSNRIYKLDLVESFERLLDMFTPPDLSQPKEERSKNVCQAEYTVAVEPKHLPRDLQQLGVTWDGSDGETIKITDWKEEGLVATLNGLETAAANNKIISFDRVVKVKRKVKVEGQEMPVQRVV